MWGQSERSQSIILNIAANLEILANVEQVVPLSVLAERAAVRLDHIQAVSHDVIWCYFALAAV